MLFFLIFIWEMHMYWILLHFFLIEIGACPLLQLYRKQHEKKCKRLTQKRRSRREVKKKPDWLEREKDTFSMSESKVTNFYLRLEKKYVFYYLVYFRLYSFCNWDFSTIAWIAILSGTECRPFVMSKTFCQSQFYDKFLRYSVNIAAEV